MQEAFDGYLAGTISLAHYLDLLDFQECTYPAGYNKLRFLENHDLPRIAAQEAHGKRRMVVDKYARLRHERRDLSGRQNGIAVHERQMDADSELWDACGKRSRIVERCAARHERRRAQHPVRHTALHCSVDELMPSEIVRIQNDLLQVVFLCVFRILSYNTSP